MVLHTTRRGCESFIGYHAALAHAGRASRCQREGRGIVTPELLHASEVLVIAFLASNQTDRV